MIEVIIFGKGYGESILIHIKDKWIVVDSFIEPKSRIPIALKYLRDNGYDIEDICGIICTHWDNDHVVGISQIIEQHSEGLTICLPIVFDDNRFYQYVLFNSDGAIGSTSEFLEVLRLIKRKKINRLYALSGRELFQKELKDQEVCVKALSPNDKQFTVFLDSISIPQKGQTKKHIPLEENKISVVTYIKTFVDSILLGGDMENSPDGWESICSCFFEGKSHVFKVPHHGSETGYNPVVWVTMVEKPISIITRFNQKRLPTPEMIKNIAKESAAVYVVGPLPEKDRNTIRRVKKYGDFNTILSMSMIDYDYGYVKLSKSTKEEDWKISTYGAVEAYQHCTETIQSQ